MQSCAIMCNHVQSCAIMCNQRRLELSTLARWRAELTGTCFIARLTMKRVSRISVSSRGSTPRRVRAVVKRKPLGDACKPGKGGTLPLSDACMPDTGGTLPVHLWLASGLMREAISCNQVQSGAIRRVVGIRPPVPLMVAAAAAAAASTSAASTAAAVARWPLIDSERL